MAMTKVVTLSPGRALAHPKAKKPTASAGLTLINEVLDVDTVQAMVDADRFARQVQEAELCYLELKDAKTLHRTWIPNVMRAVGADVVLSELTSSNPRTELTQAEASSMLQYLFGAMGKRRNDEAAAKLLACVDIFSPASNALGPALGLWKAAPKHPAILAIAIKQLMAEKTFEPAEAELREALDKLKQQLSVRKGWLWRWQEKLDEIDARVFKDDRPAWDAVYANVSSSVLAEMAERATMAGEGPSEDRDENGKPEEPGSPRWSALKALYDAKSDAEEAAEQAKLAPPPERKRIAAARKRSKAKRSKESEITGSRIR
jgi:hypothetical protein